jgi:hypothetical protein
MTGEGIAQNRAEAEILTRCAIDRCWVERD